MGQIRGKVDSAKRWGFNVGEACQVGRQMVKAKIKISMGIVIVFLISIWMGLTSNPISGIFYFFILTVLLWAIAKTRHWI